MKKLIVSLFTMSALAAASSAVTAGTPLEAHVIGPDCAIVRGAATVDGLPGAPAIGPGWFEVKGRRYEGQFVVIAAPDMNAAQLDPDTGIVRVSSVGFETYLFGNNKMFARDVTVWTSTEIPGKFQIYGTSLSGPAFDQFPDYPTWGTGAFAKALFSIRFRGTLTMGETTHGEYTIEDGTICNVDWAAL
jgi:hypothetical protein